MTEITIGHTHDADDAFMFYALFNQKLRTGNLTFSDELRPIFELNQLAEKAHFDMTALSVASLPAAAAHYDLMSCGACMAENRGPVLVYKSLNQIREVAVPGFNTSSFTALSVFAEGRGWRFRELPFHEIVPAVLAGKVDAGVTICEDQMQLHQCPVKTVDLGGFWQENFGLPLPLGVDLVAKRLTPEVRGQVTQLFHDSIAYGLNHSEEALPYALQFGRGLEPEDGLAFIKTFINDYTLNLGEKGEQAIYHFLDQTVKFGINRTIPDLTFIRPQGVTYAC